MARVPASGRLVPRSTRLRTEPRVVDGVSPPSRDDDPEIWAVADEIRRLDHDGQLFADALRDSIDQLLDGERTGRWDWLTLRKTEKTHMGTIVEIRLHNEFDFDDGRVLDYRIAGIDVDCKFSQAMGGWELPPEAIGHLCLVVTASDDSATWHAGLVRATEDKLGRPNRDMKRKLLASGEGTVLWLYENHSLPPNLLLQIGEDDRERIFRARSANNRVSGQARLNELFRTVQGEVVRRAVVATVAMQDDSMKRARDCRLEKNLGREGFLVLGHQEQDPEVAEALGLPRPSKGQFVSVRVHPADAQDSPNVEIGGTRWRIARWNDPPVSAPALKRSSRRS
jgi:hypothetical protein